MPNELPVKIEAFITNNSWILLVKRSEEDGGFWQPITGTLEFDESIKDCLFREVEEETGIKKDSVEHLSNEIYRFSWQKNDYTVVELVYAIEVNTLDVKLSFEHVEYKWCKPAEARKLLTKENNIKALTELMFWENPSDKSIGL